MEPKQWNSKPTGCLAMSWWRRWSLALFSIRSSAQYTPIFASRAPRRLAASPRPVGHAPSYRLWVLAAGVTLGRTQAEQVGCGRRCACLFNPMRRPCISSAHPSQSSSWNATATATANSNSDSDSNVRIRKKIQFCSSPSQWLGTRVADIWRPRVATPAAGRSKSVWHD